MALILDGTAGITTPALSDSGNLTFTGTGNRITGDFSNATAANRVAFQSSTANGTTNVLALPNGTGTTSSFISFSNSDPTNASFMALTAFSTEGRINSGVSGTGSNVPMTFYTGGSERMRIDSSGNVGIGTTAFGTTRLLVKNSTNNSVGVINAAAYGGNAVVGLTDVGGEASLGVGGSTVQVYTNATERMRIDSSGNLLVGTTSTGQSATQGYTFNAGGGGYLHIGHASGTGSGQPYISFGYNGSAIGSITQNGTTNVAYNTSSDYRLKENIQPMQNALARNSQLNPVTYQWKADGSLGEGFIAHELQAVCPNAVTGEKDAVDKDGNPVYQGVDTSFLVGHLVACINELKAEIDELKAKVN